MGLIRRRRDGRCSNDCEVLAGAQKQGSAVRGASQIGQANGRSLGCPPERKSRGVQDQVMPDALRFGPKLSGRGKLAAGLHIASAATTSHPTYPIHQGTVAVETI